ncbi:hypothetical protein [Stakelama pacifica]|uniref:hypothetical protein n=1 Tax=Stakelama pacifica TaxID=517720 RepID=UPI00105EBBB6|nr:hypothetical protein [Stakelama pacifica]
MTLMLCSCSYVYDVTVSMSHGRLIFDANPQWFADCVRVVSVTADDDSVRATAASGDDEDLVRTGTFLRQSISHDDGCKNHFPIAYGYTLKGRAHVYDNGGVPADMAGQRAPSVAPKPLHTGVAYTVSTVTGATGYGCGRFIIRQDRTVENLGCS